MHDLMENADKSMQINKINQEEQVQIITGDMVKLELEGNKK